MQLTILMIGLTFIAAAVVGGGLKLLGNEIPLISSTPRQVFLFLIGLTVILSDTRVRTPLVRLWRRQAVVAAVVTIIGVLIGIQGTLWVQTLGNSRVEEAERRARKAEAKATEAERQLRLLDGSNTSPGGLLDSSPPMSPLAPTAPTPQATSSSQDNKYIAQMIPIEGGRDLSKGTWTMNTTPYANSLGIDNRCSYMGYNLERKYRRFQATVGVDDNAPSGTKARFRVILDGQEIARQDAVLGNPVQIDVDVTNGLRLVLANEDASSSFDYDSLACSFYATAVWAEARLSG